MHATRWLAVEGEEEEWAGAALWGVVLGASTRPARRGTASVGGRGGLAVGTETGVGSEGEGEGAVLQERQRVGLWW
jgi:hypothetical protein